MSPQLGRALVEIRTAVRADADAVAEVHTASWRSAYVSLFPAEYLDGPLFDEHRAVWRARPAPPRTGAAPFLAVEQDGVLGFVHLEPRSGGRILIDNPHARPRHTGRGLGSLLLGHALGWVAAEHPGHDAYLEVLQGNSRAVAFHERHGGLRTASRVCSFEQGFELPEYEYTWPAAAIRASAARWGTAPRSPA
jgi:GNAT superfamily N-acetyltransferase